MLTPPRALSIAALAGLSLTGCEARDCLVSDCRLIDSSTANVRLCGFPLQQIDRSGGVSTGTLRIGQQVPLRLQGGLDRLASVTWFLEPPAHAPNPPQVALEPRPNNSAVLIGLAPGGTHPADYVWASAHLVFKDGSDGVAPVAYCSGSDWIPADHVVVR